MVLLPFCRWFESQDLDYLREAEARLKEVHALPGPIFTVGLSMGGAVSLALAAAHPDKIAKTAVFSPLLKVLSYTYSMVVSAWKPLQRSLLGTLVLIPTGKHYRFVISCFSSFIAWVQVENQQNRVFCILAGPLGAQESGWYPDMPFSLGCFVAVDAFGHFVRSNNNHVNVLAKIPTFVVLTEIDDSADVTAAKKFITGLRSCTGAVQMQLCRSQGPIPECAETRMLKMLHSFVWNHPYACCKGDSATLHCQVCNEHVYRSMFVWS